MKLTTSGGVTVATIFTSILVIASLCSTIIMQTNNAAASNVIYKQKIRGDVAVAQKTIKEGSISTTISAKGFTTTEGDKQLCVSVRQSDPDQSDTVFEGCGPARQLTIANGLGSATFGGTVTGFDSTTGEEKIVTVNAELTATGKVQSSPFSIHINSRDITEVLHSNGQIRPASGSLNIEGGITFNADDAVGIISKFAVGTIQVTKN
jgi:hypothetical protein